MSDLTVIGRTSLVRGRVTGNGDLEIAGHVEGEVAVSGEVLVETSGIVAANVSARRITVRGAVKGDLVAEESIVLEATARVVGDMRAPRVAIAHGGLARGMVQATGGPAARPRTATTSAARGIPAPAARPAASPVVREEKREERPRAATQAAPATRPAARPAASESHVAPRGATLAGARVAPPPVVPVLKKGTKAIQKKR